MSTSAASSWILGGKLFINFWAVEGRLTPETNAPACDRFGALGLLSPRSRLLKKTHRSKTNFFSHGEGETKYELLIFSSQERKSFSTMAVVSFPGSASGRNAAFGLIFDPSALLADILVYCGRDGIAKLRSFPDLRNRIACLTSKNGLVKIGLLANLNILKTKPSSFFDLLYSC